MQSNEKIRAGDEKEHDALIRMLIYLRYELMRNNFNDEADQVAATLSSIESKVYGKQRRNN